MLNALLDIPQVRLGRLCQALIKDSAACVEWLTLHYLGIYWRFVAQNADGKTKENIIVNGKRQKWESAISASVKPNEDYKQERVKT